MIVKAAPAKLAGTIAVITTIAVGLGADLGEHESTKLDRGQSLTLSRAEQDKIVTVSQRCPTC